MLVEDAEIILRGVVTLEGRSFIVASGLSVVAGYTVAVFVEITEEELRVEIILGGAVAKPGEGGIPSGNRGVCIEKELRELILGRGVAGFGVSFEFGDGRRGGRLLSRAKEWRSEA